MLQLAVVLSVFVQPAEARGISVEGRGTVETPATKASFNLTLREESETREGALRGMASRSDAVGAALRSIDPDLDLETDELRLTMVLSEKCYDEDGDVAFRVGTRGCTIDGYVAQQDYVGETLAVEQAGTMMGRALQAGARTAEVADFYLADDAQAKQDALTAAFANARAEAELLAAAGGFVLGEVLEVSTTAGRGEAIVVTGSRIAMQPEMDMVVVPVEPGMVRTSANVRVRYSIR